MILSCFTSVCSNLSCAHVLLCNPSPANMVFIASDLLLLLFSCAVPCYRVMQVCSPLLKPFSLGSQEGRAPEQAHNYSVKKLVNISLVNTDWCWWGCDLSLNKKRHVVLNLRIFLSPLCSNFREYLNRSRHKHNVLELSNHVAVAATSADCGYCALSSCKSKY